MAVGDGLGVVPVETVVVVVAGCGVQEAKIKSEITIIVAI